MFSITAGLTAAILAQIPVPGTITYGASACNAAKRAGFEPFRVSFDCVIHPGQNGCVVADTFDLDYWNGSKYPRFCQIQTQGALPLLNDAQLLLSGLRATAAGGPVNLDLFEVNLVRTSINHSGYELGWSAYFLWRNMPGTMTDSVHVEVDAMVVFSATPDIRLTPFSMGCSANTQNCATVSSIPRANRREIAGGIALSRLQLATSNAAHPYGFAPRRLAASVVDSTTASNFNVTSSCEIGGAPDVTCKFDGILISAPAGVVEPYQASQGFSDASNKTLGFNYSTGSISAMNCGVRAFDLDQDIGVPVSRAFQSLWFGQSAFDCGWTPSDRYTGAWLFGWENPYSYNYVQTNVADGVRLP